MKFKELLQLAEDQLRQNGILRPRQEALLMLAKITALDRTTILLNQDTLPSPEQVEAFKAFLERRLKNEPLSRIFQQRDFWKHTFLLSDATLDPRPDSETLIEAVLDLKISLHTILDLGVGSGCLLLSLLVEYPHAWGVGVDRSFEALQTAKQNARALGVQERCSLINSSWTKGLKGQFDLIISNPPYISTSEISSLAPDVKDYDPWLALDGGDDGLDAYRKIALGIGTSLTAHGYVLLEIGHNQQQAVSDIFLTQNLSLVKEVKDLAGITRVLVLKK